MEKPPLRGSCFHSLYGNRAQFKEAPSLRSPIVLNGIGPRAALLFPLFQPQLCQTWSNRTALGSTSRGYDSNILLSLLQLSCIRNSFAFPVRPSIRPSQDAVSHLGIRLVVLIKDLKLLCSEDKYANRVHNVAQRGVESFPVVLCARWNLHAIHFILEFELCCSLTQVFALWCTSHRNLLPVEVHLNPIAHADLLGGVELVLLLGSRQAHGKNGAEMLKRWLACGLPRQHHVMINVSGSPEGAGWWCWCVAGNW